MKSLLKMGPFVRPYWWLSILLLITVILPVAMELLVPRLFRYMIDQGIEMRNMAAITEGALYMLAAALAGTLATLGQGVCRALISQGLALDMRNRLFDHVQTFSFANLDKMQTGEIMTRLSSDVNLVRMFVSSGLALLLRAVLMVAGSVVMMFTLDWQLALVMLLLLPLAGVLIWTVMRLAQPMYTVVQQKLAALNTTVQENLAGVQVVKAFVRERFEIGRFEGYNTDYMDENIRVGRLMAVALPVLSILTNVGIVWVVWYGGVSVTGGRLSLGELVAFNNYLLIGMAPLLLLSNMLTMVSRADASAARVFEVLDTQPVVKPTPSPYNPGELQGQVTFTGVSFRYASNSATPQANGTEERNVLQDLTLEIPAGKQVALLGATGAGKSTLVHLVSRFYDTTTGQIRIDGVDIREWDLDALRKQIGVVLQETTLFSGTIRENIAYGRPDAPLEAVIAAAQAAQAHRFIAQMPDGYDSLVEERGVNLSGGQKQRLAIARALLISPRILILDDSTSAVDMETEVLIQEALGPLMAGRTTLMIAQRVSSVVNADKIVILEHGRVAAEGTHQELLASSPIYQEIYESQLGDGGKS